MMKKITTPCLPPSRPPISINSPVIRPSSSVVLKKLIALFHPRATYGRCPTTHSPSLLSLTLLHKFQQSVSDFARLDRIDRLAPENSDLRVAGRSKRTPSRRIGRTENHYARRANRGREMRHARVIPKEGRRQPRDRRNGRQIKVHKDRDAGLAKDRLH